MRGCMALLQVARSGAGLRIGMHGEVAGEVHAQHGAEAVLRVDVAGDLVCEVVGGLDPHVDGGLELRGAGRLQLLLDLLFGTDNRKRLVRVLGVGLSAEHVDAAGGDEEEQ